MENLWDITCNEWMVFILKKTKLKLKFQIVFLPTYILIYMEIYQPFSQFADIA